MMLVKPARNSFSESICNRRVQFNVCCRPKAPPPYGISRKKSTLGTAGAMQRRCGGHAVAAANWVMAT